MEITNVMKTITVVNTTALFLLLGLATPAGARQEPQEKPQHEEAPKPEKRPQEQPAKPPKQEPQEKPQKQAEPAKPEKRQQEQAVKPTKQEPPVKTQQQAKSQQKQQDQQAKSKTQQQQHTKQQADVKQQAQQQQQDKSQKQEKQIAKGQQDQQRQTQQHQQETASSRAPQRTQQAVARQRAEPALRLSARGDSRIPDDRFRSNFGSEHHFRIGEPVMVGGYSRFQYGGYWFGFVEPWPAQWYYTDDVYVDYVDGGYYMYDPYYPGSRFAISVVL
jgi:hypothetical protein